MTHEEAVIFLRQADDTVKLRLYRDVAQTPVAAMSPTNPEKGFAGGTLKAAKQFLRPEAINLLSDLAYRKQTPPCDSSGSSVNSGSNTSPRRLKRGVNKRTASTGNGQSATNYSDSEASTLSQGSFSIQAVPTTAGGNHPHLGYSSGGEDTYTIVEDGPESADFESITDDQQYYRNEEISDGVVLDDDDCDGFSMDSRSTRPSYLNLSSGGGGAGSSCGYAKKYPFQCNGFDLNNLDSELLDAPMYKQLPGCSGAAGTGTDTDYSISDCQDFVSLPCDTFIVPAESDLKRRVGGGGSRQFQHGNPVYQSVQVNSSGGGSGSGCGAASATERNAGSSGGGGVADGSAQKDGE